LSVVESLKDKKPEAGQSDDSGGAAAHM
jgi:hypothetical protein